MNCLLKWGLSSRIVSLHAYMLPDDYPMSEDGSELPLRAAEG